MSLTPADIVYLVIFFIVIFPMFVVAYYELLTKVPVVSTFPWVRGRAMKVLRKHIPEDQNVRICEFGSGWGDFALCMARHFPNASIKTLEYSPYPYLICRIKNFFLRRKVSFVREDFFKEDWSKFDILIMYLKPSVMRKVQEKIEKDKLKDFTLMTMSFHLGMLQPDEEYIVDFKLDKIPIYVYKF